MYINFLIVGYTHDDIDALFGKWNYKLRGTNYPTLQLLMKSFMDTESRRVIPHLIEEVPHLIEEVPHLIEEVLHLIEEVPHLIEEVLHLIEEVLHLIEEVPYSKKFVEGYLCIGHDALAEHTNTQQFKFYQNSNGWPLMQCKLLCTNNEWLPKGGGGIRLWKEIENWSLKVPRGDPMTLKS